MKKFCGSCCTKLCLTISFVIAILGFLELQADGEESDYYERFTGLIDTNRFGPPLTNSMLSLVKLKESGEIAGVKLGTSMSTAIRLWGKPRTFYASCGGGPLLAFGNGSLAFRGDKVVRITISPESIPGLHFENGLTATNSPAEFAKALGLAAPRPAHWRLSLMTDTGAVSLNWMHFAAGGWKLCSLTLESLELSNPKNP